MQPIESWAGQEEHPKIAERLLAESQIRQHEYDNAFEEYVQAVHEDSMRLGEESNLETRRATQSMVRATWFIAALTLAIVIAGAVQVYYLSRQVNQAPVPLPAPVVNVYLSSSGVPVSAPTPPSAR